jgi:TonB family protein
MAVMASFSATGSPGRRRSGRMGGKAPWLAGLSLALVGALHAQDSSAPPDHEQPGSTADAAHAGIADPPAATARAPAAAAGTAAAASSPAGADGSGTGAATPTGGPAVGGEGIVSRFEANDTFDRLVADQDFKAAVPVGQRLAELTEQEFGKDSRQTADVYSQLGDAQRRAGDHDGAEKSYLHAIDVYRSVDGTFTPLVIGPLVALGENYDDNRRYSNAVSAYSEARAVNRRVFGLLNEEQIPLLDRITQSLMAMNDTAEADRQQLEALRLMQRNWPPESDQALDAMYKYAAWLGETGRVGEQRDEYVQALRIITQAYGEKDVRRVRPLMGIGNSYRAQGVPENQGLSSLQEALKLLSAQNPRDNRMTAEVLRDIGDWNVAFAKPGFDGDEYREAWALLGSLDDGAKLREDWFHGPIYVLREPINLTGITQDPDAPEGHVTVKFDLDTSGRPDNVEVVQSDPAGLKDDAMLRAVRRSRFRPQMTDGELVPGKLALKFSFQYKTDEDKHRKHGA